MCHANCLWLHACGRRSIAINQSIIFIVDYKCTGCFCSWLLGQWWEYVSKTGVIVEMTLDGQSFLAPASAAIRFLSIASSAIPLFLSVAYSLFYAAASAADHFPSAARSGGEEAIGSGSQRREERGRRRQELARRRRGSDEEAGHAGDRRPP